MTLNLTLLHPTYVMQVSDRRLTDTLSGAVFDQMANKNVVYLARDGLFSICYSGRAYVDHVPTDTWIACKLADEEMDAYKDGRGLREGGQGVLMRSGKERWLDIGQAVELLRRECRPSLEIMVAGWQKYSGGMRPVCWGIERRGRRTAAVKDVTPADWHEEEGRPYRLAALPGEPGWLSDSEGRRLVELLQFEAMSVEAAVRRLVWAVRYVAARPTPEVGPHCMCILLPNPDVQPELFVRYEPVTEGRAVITGGERSFDIPAAFTPWYVGPQIHAPPRTIVGNAMQLMLGHIKIIEHAPSVPRGKGILGGWSTQQRPVDPSARP